MSRLALLLGAALGLSGAASPTPDAATVRAEARAYRAAHEVEIVRSFADLLALPNVASDREGIARNADAIRTAFARRGFRTELLEAPGGSPPAVFAERTVSGARRTVVFYAHYDGQPVRPEQWTTPPWRPVLRDRALRDGGREMSFDGLRAPLPPEARIYARSASDDKAPIVGLLAALDALASARREPSVNLKFFFEGEEEAGSPHLADLLAAHASRLSGDLWILLDGPVHQTRRQALYFGARGVVDLEITLYGPARALHSGHYGNWAVNPIAALVRLLATMRDDDGKILVAGFGDDVRPPTAEERRAVAEVPPVEPELRNELLLGRTEGGGESLPEAVLRPAMNLRGISGGAVGAATANAIPTEAIASIDFRLVPDQTPENIRRRVEAHVRDRGYLIVAKDPTAEERRKNPRVARLVWGPGYPAARTPMDLPAARGLVRAVEEWNGGPVVRLPTLGGSVPMYLFGDLLHAPVVGLPIVNHDNDQHAADENLRLKNLWDGIEIYASVIARMGALWPGDAR